MLFTLQTRVSPALTALSPATSESKHGLGFRAWKGVPGRGLCGMERPGSWESQFLGAQSYASTKLLQGGLSQWECLSSHWG